MDYKEKQAVDLVKEFYDIPVAVTVVKGSAFGAYIGNLDNPYALEHDPQVLQLAIDKGLFNTQMPGEFRGQQITWWMNKRA